MKQNMKSSEKLLRLVIGATMIIIFMTRSDYGFWSIFLLIIGLALVITGICGYSPLYALFSKDDKDEAKENRTTKNSTTKKVNQKRKR